MKTANDYYYNTHQEVILSNTVTESDIYTNYSSTSYVNWKIEKTPKTHLKKLEFSIDRPEIGLKKIDFDIIANNDEIDDMNDDKIVYPSDNLTNDMYNNIDYQNVWAGYTQFQHFQNARIYTSEMTLSFT